MKFLGIGRALVAVLGGPLSLLLVAASEEEEDWTLPIILVFVGWNGMNVINSGGGTFRGDRRGRRTCFQKKMKRKEEERREEIGGEKE